MSAPEIGRFLRDNESCFLTQDFPLYLQRLFARKNITKATLAKRSGMSEAYLYQLFSGKRNPSRNRAICLCFGLSASLEEAQELLKVCGSSPLYVKNRRDAIIIHGLANGLSLTQVNDTLYCENESTLF